MNKLIEVNDDTFNSEVMNSELPVLVDFSAVWCGPCKQLAPTLEALAEEYSGKFKIAKVDVDNNNQVTQRYKIMHLPTLMVFKRAKCRRRLPDTATRLKYLILLISTFDWFTHLLI